MFEDGENSGQQPENNNEVIDNADAPERPDWLLDKYATEGKSISDATNEQAKAYNELSGRFGAFTGAPEEYEVALNEELTEMGITMNKDDPMVEAAIKFATDSNMSQDGFSKMIELYSMQQVANNQAQEEYKAQQLNELGPSGNARIENIQQWANKNLDAESVAGLEQMATSADSIKVIEQLIAMGRGKSVDVNNAQNNSGANAEDVRKMQFEKDENGNRKINTDKDFRARYQKMMNEVYGTEEHRTMVG